jgi:hypothetical protein
MERCVAGVASSGAARDEGAVCGATWWTKSPRERLTITRMEESMATKKKKKKKKNKPAHRKATHHKTKRTAHHKASKKKTKAAQRCPACGHTARHGKAGCLHHDGSHFCSCRHR